MTDTATKQIAAMSAHDRELLAKLNDVINGDERPVLLGREGAHIQFPEPLLHHLTQIVRAMLKGQSVVVLAENEVLTTQAAANYLGVSRPYLVKLLVEEKIPFHYVGSHRRIYMSDLRTYERLRDTARRKTLDALTKKVQEAGLYASDYTGD